jgi:hypothetical protein
MELGGPKLMSDSLLAAKLLFVLASTVIVGCSSQGTNDHIVFSHGSEGIPRVLWQPRIITLFIKACWWSLSRQTIPVHSRLILFPLYAHMLEDIFLSSYEIISTPSPQIFNVM